MVYTTDKKEFMAKASEISVTKETAEELIIPSQFTEYQRIDTSLSKSTGLNYVNDTGFWHLI
jgi:hypothetical protein